VGASKTHVKIKAASGHGSELLPFEFVGNADGVAKLWGGSEAWEYDGEERNLTLIGVSSKSYASSKPMAGCYNVG
jgi:hypothetical protein